MKKKRLSTASRRPEGRAGASVDALKQSVLENLRHIQGRHPAIATANDWYMALAHTVRDRLLDQWMETLENLSASKLKVVSYLSAEFLPGPHLGNNLINLGLYDQAQQALAKLDQDLGRLLLEEEEPGLGNGGLGRLAACFMDSMSTIGVLAIGYGLRYEFGIFDQEIRDGWQVEVTDKWLHYGNPWEIARPEINYAVGFGGRTEPYTDLNGKARVRWIPHQTVRGVAYDTPIAGFDTETVNLLRLWKAEACESFDFQAFNVGDYYRAVEEKVRSENISKVLYPNDEPLQGKKLRLQQQYFFVSCALQDMLRLQRLTGGKVGSFDKHFAVQLNDTHPAIGVVELMRLLVDEHGMEWDAAWQITQKTFSYTNHTLLPEALEKWGVTLFGELLPRHLEIIFELNRRFVDEIKTKYPEQQGRIAQLSLFEEGQEKSVRMANLATLGSHTVNGVSALHSELLKQSVLRDFHEIWPDKFVNVTNGVTPRRWIALSNPALAALLSRELGDDWLKYFEEEAGALEEYLEDAGFQREWRAVKQENKFRLARQIKERTGIALDPKSLFDIQVKRIHEYKRQHLNALHILTLYNRIKNNPKADITPRTFVFGGKAAPGYFMAKLIIKLINSMAEVVNNDKEVAGRLKVVFYPDFNVTNSHAVYPAADLSEQISTAGKEASGTGNMKFTMNGALTIGTLDGANVEIRDEVGEENFFLFGLTAEQVLETKRNGYNPRWFYDNNAELRQALDTLCSGQISRGDVNLFRPLVDSLLGRDEYLLLADYQSYVECQEQVSLAYQDQKRWTRMSILNTARSGKFSSDRSIREYCERIWKVKPQEA